MSNTIRLATSDNVAVAKENLAAVSLYSRYERVTAEAGITQKKEENIMYISVEKWRTLCEDYVRRHAGISENQIKQLVGAAICADTRGVSSHGTTRILTYVERLKLGLINKDPQIKIIGSGKAAVHMDADNGLGQTACTFAIHEAIHRARKYGVCSVSIRNINHIGMLSHYSLIAADNRMISYIMCNTPPCVAPWGGMEPAVGTNPLCWAVPAKPFPIVMDMAISSARGKIRNALDKGETIPEGWAIDKFGRPTTDAKEALEGCLLPVGGVKGYGIGVMAECFTGILSGANYGNNVTQPFDDLKNSPDLGVYMLVTDVEQMMSTELFMHRVSDYISMIKATKKAEGVSEIFVPGELEYYCEEKAKEEGLEISEAQYKKIIS